MATQPKTYSMKAAAKILGIGVVKLFRILRAEYVLTAANLPHPVYHRQGYFIISEKTFAQEGFGDRCHASTKVTPIGIDFLKKLLARYELAERDRHDLKISNLPPLNNTESY